MKEMTFYIEALGFLEDECGNPAHGGMAITLGNFKPGCEIPYSELIKNVDPMDLVSKLLPEVAKILSDVRFITPEEHDEKYGGDDECI